MMGTEWTCELCAEFGVKGQDMSCVLCPNRGGIMKPVELAANSRSLSKEDGSVMLNEGTERLGTAWIHLSCAYWTPEASFKNEVTKEPVIGVELIDQKRFSLTCTICNKKEGCCVQCGKGTCNSAFHIECARLAGLFMEYVAKAGEVVYKVYCEKHRPLRLLRGMEQAQKKSIDEILNFCKIIEKCNSLQGKLETTTKSIKKKRREKVFAKPDRSKLIKRVQQICKQMASLSILLERENDGYHILPTMYQTTYSETLSKVEFPWNDVMFDKFTAMNCYNEYRKIVPDEETFRTKVLQQGKKRVSSERGRNNKHDFVTLDPTPYCICRRMYHETDDMMIGIWVQVLNVFRLCWRKGMSV